MTREEELIACLKQFYQNINRLLKPQRPNPNPIKCEYLMVIKTL